MGLSACGRAACSRYRVETEAIECVGWAAIYRTFVNKVRSDSYFRC